MNCKIVSSILCLAIFMLISGCMVKNSLEPKRLESNSYNFQKLNFIYAKGFGASFAELDGVRILLQNPDNRYLTTVWEGPLKVVDINSGKEILVNLSLITNIYADINSKIIAIITYSGSMSSIHFYDLKSGNQKWLSIKVFTEGIQLESNKLIILPGCETINNQSSHCSSAKIYQIFSETGPILSEKDSMALTKEVLGVEFLGEKKVIAPKTKHARLAD